MRKAFSLPEVLVAIVVLSVGLLGLATSGTWIALQAGEARRFTEGAILAGRVIDSLRSLPCASVGSGSLVHARSAVRWTAVPATRTVTIQASLEIAGRRGPRQWPIEVLLPCER